MIACVVRGIMNQCRFCCNIANWFCWGNTHFCDSCHHQQVRPLGGVFDGRIFSPWCALQMIGNNIARKKVKDLPRCPGDMCPLKIRHPPNGQEYSLGCALCRRHGKTA